MSNWDSILSEIVTVLEGIDSIENVSDYEKSQFSGFPAATVVPSEEESDFQATSERTRTYAFSIRCYQDMLSKQHPYSPGLEDADRILRKVVDDIVSEFDKPANARLSGNADTDGHTVVLVRPVPSTWGYDSERNLRSAEIILRVVVHVDTNQIS